MPTKLEDRVSELEREVADLKKAISETRPEFVPRKVPKDAWHETVGAFKDDPIYDEIVRRGAAYRRREKKC